MDLLSMSAGTFFAQTPSRFHDFCQPVIIWNILPNGFLACRTVYQRLHCLFLRLFDHPTHVYVNVNIDHASNRIQDARIRGIKSHRLCTLIHLVLLDLHTELYSTQEYLRWPNKRLSHNDSLPGPVEYILRYRSSDTMNRYNNPSIGRVFNSLRCNCVNGPPHPKEKVSHWITLITFNHFVECSILHTKLPITLSLTIIGFRFSLTKSASFLIKITANCHFLHLEYSVFLKTQRLLAVVQLSLL